MHWAGAHADAADPALPEGVDAARRTCHQPRRPRRWRGGWRRSASSSRAEGPALPRELKPGQRLVSRGRRPVALGRFLRSPPTRRPARRAGSPARNRLADIEARAARARATTSETRRAAVRTAEAEVAATPRPRPPRRNRRRELQREADCRARPPCRRRARVGPHHRPPSALAEAQDAARPAALAEAQAAARRRRGPLGALPPLGGAQGRTHRDRAPGRAAIAAGLAEARAEAQALAREIELAKRRLAAIGAEAAGVGASARAAPRRRSRTLEARLAETQDRARRPRRHARSLSRRNAAA